MANIITYFSDKGILEVALRIEYLNPSSFKIAANNFVYGVDGQVRSGFELSVSYPLLANLEWEGITFDQQPTNKAEKILTNRCDIQK